VLFGQAPLLKAFWKPPGGGEETAETVKWEVVEGSETAPNGDPKGLYPGKPAVFFTGGVHPYEHAELRVQTVHTGSFVLKATTKDANHKGPDGQPAKIEITFSVEAPAGLHHGPGPVNQQYDGLIIQSADKYGLPPQIIKRQVWHESDHEYKPDAYRYEPLSWDIGTDGSVGLLNGIWQWTDERWRRDSMEYFRFPSGMGLGPGDLELRSHWKHIVQFDASQPPPVLPYTCDEFGMVSGLTAPLVDIYTAYEGWRPKSYPHTLYNPNGGDSIQGPCHVKRQNWSVQAGMPMAYHAWEYYCGSGTIPGAACSRDAQTIIGWLCNHPNYVSQTAIGSSYGLMQMMYWNAVNLFKWNENGTPFERAPVDLFIPEIAIDLGCSADAMFVLRYAPRDSLDRPTNLLQYQEGLANGIQQYNPRWKNPQTKLRDYGPDQVKGAIGFMPY
jgi:hypothetical protein